MGTIQNTLNAALATAAKAETAVADIQAMQGSESVKALKERNEIKADVQSDIEDLKEADENVKEADKGIKESQNVVKSLEDEYNRGVIGTDEFKAS